MSAEIDILYPVECPTCFASPGNRCRSLKLRRVTDYHVARREKWLHNSALGPCPNLNHRGLCRLSFADVEFGAS